MRVGIVLADTEGCCGVTQVTEFSTEWGNWVEPQIEGEGTTKKTAYKNLFNNLMEYEVEPEDHGNILQMWFQKNRKYDGTFDDECQAEELRVLIETIPECVFLGEFVNPNSGNKIMGYQWQAN